jgi:cell division protein FtsQ
MSAPTIDRSTVRVDFGDRGHRRARRLRILGGVLLVVLAGVCVWLVWFSSVLSVKDVRVLGVEGGAAKSVLDAASVPVGVQLARVDTGQAQADVLRLPWVGSVEVRRGWPSEVVIAVVPRTPIAVVSTGQARRVVDAAGVVFEAAPLPKGLPSVAAEGVGLAAAMGVLASLPVDISGRVVSLSATTRDDVDLRFRSGVTVHWGSVEQPELKAEVLRALLRRKADVYDVTAPELPTTFSAR